MIKGNQTALFIIAIVLLCSTSIRTASTKQIQCYQSLVEEQKLFSRTELGRQYLKEFKHLSSLLDEFEQKKGAGSIPQHIKEAEHKSSQAWNKFLEKHEDEYKKAVQKTKEECKGVPQKTIKRMTHQVEEGRKSFEPKKKAPAHNLKLSAPSISWFKKRSPFKYVYVPASCLGPTSKAGLINFGMFAAGKMNLLRYPVKEENKIKLRKIMADCMDELLKEEEEEKEPSKSMKNMEVHKRKIVEMKPDGTLLE